MLSDMSLEGDDEDMPQLPTDTLQLLADFRLEKDAREKQFEDLKQAAESKFDDGKPLSMELFGEDCKLQSCLGRLVRMACTATSPMSIM